MKQISDATKRNWEKLNVVNLDNKLMSRANKKRSKKRIFPIEYLLNKSNKNKLTEIVERIEASSCTTYDAILTLCCNQLLHLNRFRNCSIAEIGNILTGQTFTYIKDFEEIAIPLDEHDFLGAIYQSLKFEGDKNVSGSYYTPLNISTDLLAIEEGATGTIFDPCCGTGGILLAANTKDPTLLYGCDIDFLATVICKTNLLTKYSDLDFVPNIFHLDFFSCNRNINKETSNSDQARFVNCIPEDGFDLIATNPPWGADVSYQNTQIKSGESASLTLVHSERFLKSNGTISFLLPKALLNIATHSDIRNFLKANFAIQKLQYYPNVFVGVTTEFVNVQARLGLISKNLVKINRQGKSIVVPQNNLGTGEDNIFSLIDEADETIIDKVNNKTNQTLAESIWALGVVTGDNKNKLSDNCAPGMEPIYTGKDIQRYKLSTPKKYITFDPSKMQQVAKVDYYRAKEKIVYKFISKKLIFALDSSGSLCLNSANLIIPQLENLSNKALLAFLNSTLYQYLYITLFDDVKILKKNLCALPLPKLNAALDLHFSKFVDIALKGEGDPSSSIDKEVFEYFGIDESEVKHIQEIVYG